MKIYLDNCCYNRPFDSLHLAVTENKVDYFLTTDVKLIKASKRTKLSYDVLNPIDFVLEVADDE